MTVNESALVSALYQISYGRVQKGFCEMTTRSLFRFTPQALSQHKKSLWRLALGLGALAMLLLLVPLTTPVAHAAFPGTNGKIVFSSNRDGNEEIYTMNPDGSNVTRLTNNSANDQYPSWSADGTKIVFDSNRDGNFEIYVMDADGSNQTRLTSNSSLDAIPSWSPGGNKILFYSNRDGNDEIYVMNSDGTSQTNCTNNSASDVQAVWSPDGTKIAFESTRSGSAQVFTMNANCSNVTQRTSSGSNGGADWSPDGSQIAFHSNRDANYEVYKMNADGTSQTRLTTDGAAEDSPVWSPDGTQIAFRSVRDGNQEVYTMNADGTSQTNRTSNSASDGDPSWQPIFNLAVNPTKPLVQEGSTTVISIYLNSVSNVYGYQFEVNYDSSKVSAVGAFNNTFFDTTTDASVPSGWNAACASGVCKFAASKVSPATAINGFGKIAQITFTGISAGNFALSFSSNILSDPEAATISHTSNSATVVVYGTATVNGTVNLQGRTTPGDASGTVTLSDQSGDFLPTTVNFGPSNGNFSATVPALAGGTTYDVLGAHSLYLKNAYTGLAVTAGGTFNPSPATTKLFGGDANNDGSIGLGDLTCIGGAFGGAPVVCGTTGSSDINADSTTNILDLVLTGGNYGKSGTQMW
jgi:Tol biopolymer transport system component